MTQKQIDAYLRLMDPQILEERTHQDKSGVWEDCINNRPAGEYKIRTNTVAGLAASPQEAVEADMARLICESREILKPSL